LLCSRTVGGADCTSAHWHSCSQHRQQCGSI